MNELVKCGFKVYAVARKPVSITGAEFISADVTDERAVRVAIDEVVSLEGRLDLLVNNAGYGISGAIEFTDTAKAKNQFDVNFFGAMNCAKAAIPHLRKTGGMIINMGSIAAVFAVPFQAMYSASKWALSAFTLALRNELKPFGIRVCTVYPGDIATGFSDMRQRDEGGSDVYGDVIKNSIDRMEKDELNGHPPEKIGRSVARLSGKKSVRPVYVVGVKYKIFAYLNKIMPTALVYKVVRLMYAK